jgi:hypothetical protein
MRLLLFPAEHPIFNQEAADDSGLFSFPNRLYKDIP